MEKNYMIFAGDVFYPCGGWDDFYAFAETLDEANMVADEAVATGSVPGISWNCAMSYNDYDKISFPRNWSYVVCMKRWERIDVEKELELERLEKEKKQKEDQAWRDAWKTWKEHLQKKKEEKEVKEWKEKWGNQRYHGWERY